MEAYMNQRGIVLATFGSIYGDAVEASVGAMERRIAEMYPGIEVRRVFLSDALVDKWNEKYDTKVFTLSGAVEDLARNGVTELFIQPFALVWDQCYVQMRKEVMKDAHERGLRVTVGKPLLNSLGVKNYADDYSDTIEAIIKHINIRALNKSVLLMANGQNQLEYSALQLKCLYGAGQNVVVFTANGFPNFKQALTLLERLDHQEVLVVPLALIGSAHLMDYLGGDRSDSIATLLGQQGYGVSIWNEGLGENPFVQELFVKHLAQVIRSAERRNLRQREGGEGTVKQGAFRTA